MFKYIKFTKVETENTVLEFRGEAEGVKVNHFDVDVVSIESDVEADIDTLVSSQPAEIKCIEITQDEFKTLVSESSQLNRIREVVKTEIAKKYSVADEIAIGRRDEINEKRVAYEYYVKECINIGNKLKKEIGY